MRTCPTLASTVGKKMKKEESRLKGNKTASIYSKLYICCMYVDNSKIVCRKYMCKLFSPLRTL